EKDVLESILNDTLSGYYDFDFVNKRLYYSSGFRKLLGYEEYEMGSTFDQMKEFFVMEDEATVMECFNRHIESHGEIPFYNEARYKHKDGSIVWMIFTGHVIEWGPDNTPLQMIGCHINITDLKLLEKSLNDERELLKATLLSMGDAVITTDKYGNVGIVNAVAEKLTGWSQDEVTGEPFDKVFKFINTDSKETYKNPLDNVLKTGEMIQDQNQMIIISKNGKEIPIEDSASPIKDENGTLNGAVLVFRDFTEKKEKQDRIEYLSLHDQLTGLYNRRFFEEELKRLDTTRNLPLTIVMLDVNGLKLINDAFGHAMGDLTLQRAAIIMKEECRSDEIIARFGGDEFVILLPETGHDDAEKLVKRIYTAFETEIIDNISVSVSCGWATKQDHSENLANIFKLAEDHMYRRKLSESKSMHHKTIDTILKTLHGKSEREKNHSERVGELCESIAIALNMNSEDVKEFRTIGLMHDIGKIAIDLSILNKPGNLDKMERAEIERHPEVGYQILRSINEFAKLAEYTLSHHERWDGTGYPRKLKGEEIPFEARIIAIADAYDSMTSNRSYRKAMNRKDAVKEIKNGAGKQFDPDIVNIFVNKVLESN
ncbi:MAG TPA: HD domain-containing phosphohydrolase, partial [Anaerovoracaceae bacterium]|nr:HD domain-containing phosphohydrolase [Anaerovoracaceae bacterium]